MTKTNVKKAVAIGVLGVGLTSLAPLARGTVFGEPITVRSKTSVVSIDTTQDATDVTVQKRIVTEKEKLINLERKYEIAKVDALLQNAKPNDIAKLVQEIKIKGSSDKGQKNIQNMPFIIVIAVAAAVATAVNCYILAIIKKKINYK